MEDSTMLSQLSSGFPEAASEQARLMGMISNGGLIFLMLCVGLLAFKPSWPLAAGVVSADLRTEFVANQPVSPGWMVSVSRQALRTLAGGL
jgi:hypothetical protein